MKIYTLTMIFPETIIETNKIAEKILKSHLFAEKYAKIEEGLSCYLKGYEREDVRENRLKIELLFVELAEVLEICSELKKAFGEDKKISIKEKTIDMVSI